MGSSQAYMSARLSVCLSVCLSLCLSVSLYNRPRRFLAIIRAACNCAQRMRPQATGSNPLSGSIICPSVRLSGRMRQFCNFGIFVLISSVGVQRHDAFTPTLGSKGSMWGPVELICPSVSLSIRLYLCLSVQSPMPLFGDQSVRPVIACSACGRRPRSQIP